MEMPCFLAAFAGNIDLWSAMWARGGGSNAVDVSFDKSR